MTYFCHSSKGRLFVADPRAKDQGDRKWWMLLSADPGIVDFYNWLCIRHGWEMLKGSRYGPHISVVSGEKPKYIEVWNQLPNTYHNFEYSNEIRTDGDFVWVDVRSNELEQVRTELGLPARPYFSFHLTIGRLKFFTKMK